MQLKFANPCFLLIAGVFICLSFTKAEKPKHHTFSAPGPDSLFAIVYTIGEKWDSGRETQEQAYFKHHSAHLSALRKQGLIKLGGRFSDKGLLLVVFKDMGEALAVTHSDSSVINRIFKAEVYRFNAFYKGCVE